MAASKHQYVISSIIIISAIKCNQRNQWRNGVIINVNNNINNINNNNEMAKSINNGINIKLK
jgi:hypothetical protein